MKQCVVGIKGKLLNPYYPVDVWFDSLKSAASVLSEENQKLLQTISEFQPKTVSELARISNRAVSNLSRTIKTLEKHGILTLEKHGASVQPHVKYDEFHIICADSKQKDMFKRQFTLVSMFTGVGGLDMGFEGGFKYKDQSYPYQPFENIAAYEKDSKCVETIKQNLTIPIHEHDLTTDSTHSMPQADLLIGGFPCQDFSSCGPKKGLTSDRGQLYQVMIEYMRVHQPKVVCAENVPNLARMQGGAVLKKIKEDLIDAGYKVQIWDLFAPDYGIPQSRRRLFFVCTRADLTGEPQPPLAKFKDNPRGTKWAIEDIEHIDDESISNQSQYFKASKAKKGNGQGDEKCKADKPSYTIRANAKSRVQFHYKLERRLTVRECARLQTFPDEFIFPHSATSNVMQIGNAVPPVLAYQVASSIRDYLVNR